MCIFLWNQCRSFKHLPKKKSGGMLRGLVLYQKIPFLNSNRVQRKFPEYVPSFKERKSITKDSPFESNLNFYVVFLLKTCTKGATMLVFSKVLVLALIGWSFISSHWFVRQLFLHMENTVPSYHWTNI